MPHFHPMGNGWRSLRTSPAAPNFMSRLFGRAMRRAWLANATLFQAHGAQAVRWRRDGKELFYLGFDGRVQAVPVRLSPKPHFGPATALFTISTEARAAIHSAGWLRRVGRRPTVCYSGGDFGRGPFDRGCPELGSVTPAQALITSGAKIDFRTANGFVTVAARNEAL